MLHANPGVAGFIGSTYMTAVDHLHLRSTPPILHLQRPAIIFGEDSKTIGAGCVEATKKWISLLVFG